MLNFIVEEWVSGSAPEIVEMVWRKIKDPAEKNILEDAIRSCINSGWRPEFNQIFPELTAPSKRSFF